MLLDDKQRREMMKNNKFKKAVIALGMTLSFISPTAVSANEVTNVVSPAEETQLANLTKNVFIFDDQAEVPSERSIAPRLSFDTFYSGMTGIPGFGTVWAEFHPRSRAVAVQVSGKSVSTGRANAGGRAYASAPRAFSGNTSRWWWL
ncbi:hypothetical protein D920_02914 [Enterococcus faecalis 13-SD-W-01]|nr:hypothetical protein D920_02914 [Enterococcus faecalis 13-SD-W-01]